MTPFGWVDEESAKQMSDEELVNNLVSAASTNNEMDCRQPLEVLRQETINRLYSHGARIRMKTRGKKNE